GRIIYEWSGGKCGWLIYGDGRLVLRRWAKPQDPIAAWVRNSFLPGLRPNGTSNNARHRRLGKAHVSACAGFWAGEKDTAATAPCAHRKSQRVHHQPCPSLHQVTCGTTVSAFRRD